MIILEDTRNQLGKHDLKRLYFEQNGIEIRRTKLYCGDYTLPTNQSICIDTKNSIQELIGDIQTDHERFRNELLRASEAGIKLYILVENKGTYLNSKKTIWNENVTCIQDLFKWKNPRAFIFRHGQQLYPNCAKGEWIAKCCITMEKKYGCKFVFCTPEDAGKRVIEILTGGSDV